MKFPSSIFIFLYPHSHNRVMNRVSPIFEDEHESSADSIHRRLEVRVTHCTAQEEGTAGPRTCKICLEEEAAKQGQGVPAGQEEGNAMIIPCDCRGSVGYVHQKCIRMWIEKQFQTGKTKRAYCEICKSQIFFKKVKVHYCDCHMGNLCDISPCNVVCIVAEIILVAVVALIQYYVDRVMNFQLLRNSLLALLGILSLTLFITVFLVLKEVFLKTYKEIERIYSVAESEQLGLKEPHCRQEPTAQTSLSKRPKIVPNRKGRQSKVNTRLSNASPFQSIIPQLIVAHS